jgi:hypothetical protein
VRLKNAYIIKGESDKDAAGTITEIHVTYMKKAEAEVGAKPVNVK